MRPERRRDFLNRHCWAREPRCCGCRRRDMPGRTEIPEHRDLRVSRDREGAVNGLRKAPLPRGRGSVTD
jgi:hypothetical protein